MGALLWNVSAWWPELAGAKVSFALESVCIGVHLRFSYCIVPAETS
jgi:hypothetical protein